VTGFAGAAVLFAAWTFVELRAEHPLLDPRLFRIAGLRSACLGMTTIFFGMFALFYVNASFLQYAKGFGVLGAGLQATTREFGSALGVAVIGTVMTAKSRGPDFVTAFVAGADAGLRVVGIAVLILGVLVVAQSRVSPGSRVTSKTR
jgi:hypothetical protein